MSDFAKLTGPQSITDEKSEEQWKKWEEMFEILKGCWKCIFSPVKHEKFSQYLFCYSDGLVQERRNSIANALELRLSCTNPFDMINF